MKLQFPAVVSARCETGEVESLVLRRGSRIGGSVSGFPGVTEPCEVGWISRFRVKMIKAEWTASYHFHAAKTSSEVVREAFSWQTIMHGDAWPC